MTGPAHTQRAVGDVGAQLTEDRLIVDIWEPSALPDRDRSLITIASLVTSGNVEQLVGHLMLAKKYGLTQAELTETIVHLAFYAGWPRTLTAIDVVKQVFGE